MTYVGLANELSSFLIRCLGKENGKNDCIFWNTQMCDGIKVCSSCSMHIEKEGERNEN